MDTVFVATGSETLELPCTGWVAEKERSIRIATECCGLAQRKAPLVLTVGHRSEREGDATCGVQNQNSRPR